MTTQILARVDADLNVTGTVDPECKRVWFPLGILKGYTPVLEAAHTFISTQGRMKYLMPIYQALLDSNQKDLAVKWYQENVNFYHPYSVAKLAKMIGITTAEVQQMQAAKNKANLFMQ